MRGLTSKLRNKVTLYAKRPIKNELGEDTFEYLPVKNIYCYITNHGGSNTEKAGNSTQSSTSHRFVFRSSAVDELTDDMYFVYKNIRYDIEFFNYNFKYNDSIEVLVKQVGGAYKNG